MSHPLRHHLIIVLIVVILTLTFYTDYIFSFDHSLPTFPTDKFLYDDSNATELFIRESIDQFATKSFTPFRYPFKTVFERNTLKRAFFVLELSGTLAVEYKYFSDIVSNGTIHELYGLLLNLTMEKFSQVLPGTYDTIIIALKIMIHRNLDSKDCFFLPTIPSKILSLSKEISLYLTIIGNGYDIDCDAEYLISPTIDQRWNIMIQEASLSNSILGGNYIFNMVDFGPLCRIVVADFLVFIKSTTSHSLPISYINGKAESLVFIDSVMDKISLDFMRTIKLLIVSNSVIRVGDFYCKKIDNVWLFNSKILLGTELIVQSSDQFILFNTTIIQTNNHPLHMRIEYAKIIFIDNFKNANPLLVSFSHSFSVAMKNLIIDSTSIIPNSMFSFIGIKLLSIQSSVFKGNDAKRIIDIGYSGRVDFKSVVFEDNTASDSAIHISQDSNQDSFIRCVNCIFIRNKAGSKGVITSFLPFYIYNSVFKENEGIDGGAIYLECAFFIIDSIFKKNKATNNGGALYISAIFDEIASITSTHFEENQVDNLSDVKLCGKYNCDGSGGAIFYNQNKDHLTISTSVFLKNSAVRGGAIFANMDTNSFVIDTSTFKDNVVSYAGGAIFQNSDSFLPLIDARPESGNKAKYFGDTIASSIFNVMWKVQLEGQMETLLEGNQTISVYPGQLFSIIPVLSDLFNNSIPINKEVSTIKLDGGNFTIGQSSEKEFTNLFIASTGVISNSNSQSSTSIVSNSNSESKTRLTVSFLKKETNITIQILACPNNYFLKDNQLSMTQVCVYEESKEYIIAVAVSLTIVVFTLFLCSIGVLSMICYKASIKIKYWMRRDKAEKEIEKRLLDSDLHPEEEEMKSVKSLNFVISIDQITLERKIGEGGSGVVYFGKWYFHPVAIKCIKIHEGYQNSDEIEKEASILCKLRHPNIVQCYGVSLTPQKQYLIMDYMDKGSLEKHISAMKRKQQFEFIEKLKLLIDISTGMSYLHSLKVIHRDLKPGNILLDSAGNAKICDFGISRIAGNTTANSTTICAGTLTYMAPELLQSEGEKSKIRTAVDVYSFSIIMYEILFEEAPFAKSAKIKQFKQERNKKFESEFYNSHLVTPFSVISKVIKGVRPEIPFQNTEEIGDWLQLYMHEYSLLSDDGKSKSISIVNDYVELMQACWNPEPELRPNFETILSCISVLRQQFLDISDYSKQVSSGSLSSTSTTSTIEYYQ